MLKNIKVYSVVIKDKIIYAATEEGLKSADYENINLVNFNFWKIQGSEVGLSETECQQKLAEWEKEQAVLMAELNNPKAEKDKRQEVMKRYSAHYQQRRSFVTQTTTGFVWLYIQK